MEFNTQMIDSGFCFSFESGEDRTRFVAWEARGESGILDSGEVEISYVNAGTNIKVDLGYCPQKVELKSIRDPTPGIHQPFDLPLPPGSFQLDFVSFESFQNHPLDLMVSPSGSPHDYRQVNTISSAKAGLKHTVQFIANSSWKRLFIKSKVKITTRIMLSSLVLSHGLTGHEYEALNHNIKPESGKCKKEGRSSLIFEEGAGAYSYFSIGFQRR